MTNVEFWRTMQGAYSHLGNTVDAERCRREADKLETRGFGLRVRLMADIKEARRTVDRVRRTENAAQRNGEAELAIQQLDAIEERLANATV